MLGRKPKAHTTLHHGWSMYVHVLRVSGCDTGYGIFAKRKWCQKSMASVCQNNLLGILDIPYIAGV